MLVLHSICRLLCCIFLSAFITQPQVLGQQLTCNGEFTAARYADGGRFLSDIGSKSYDCSCRGQNCDQIVCIVLESTENNSTENSDEVCRDPKTGRVYARGTNFVRYGSDGVNLACTCTSNGPLKITCKQPSCKIPPPPPPTRRESQSTSDSCYDQHNDNWYPYNIPYTRRVVMSYFPDIIGEYNCVCNQISTRCTATDIPCCDTTTGTFAGKNQRFKTIIDGSPASCVCLGGRGKAGQCERLNDRREMGSSQVRIVKRRRCFDHRTNRYYHEGAVFVQLRKAEEMRCSCRRRRRNRLAISCRPRK